jgi:hypothetical protein
MTPTATGPTILDFRADVDTADPGDTVTLTWSTLGATRAILYKLFYSGQLSSDGRDVAPSGSMTYTIPLEERNWVNLMLYVEDDAGNNTMATVSIELRCPDPWFFTPPPEDICPTEPLISRAAEQHFERGTMVWLEAERAIYVLYGGDVVGSRWHRFDDTWDETLPDRDPDLEPPAGLQQPVRGFGWVWREQPGVRDALGWATDQERAFTSVMQRTTRYKYNAWYLLALDGDVWALGPEGSSWDSLTPSGLTVDLGD